MGLHTNQPYNKPIFDQILRTELAKDKNIRFEDVSHAFKSVAVVGMLIPDLNQKSRDDFSYFDEDNKKDDPYSLLGLGMIEPKQLWHDDLDMLKDTASIFSQANIPLHPEVKFHIYNLLPPVSSDFLLHTNPFDDYGFPKADLVSVHYILKNGATPDMHRDYNTSAGFPKLDHSQFDDYTGKLTSVSALNRDRSIWPRASFDAGAKFVVTYGGTHDEITTENFKNHRDSVTLLCSQREERARRKRGHRRKKGQYSQHEMGIVAHKNAVLEYLPHVYKSSVAGEAMQRKSHSIKLLKSSKREGESQNYRFG